MGWAERGQQAIDGGAQTEIDLVPEIGPDGALRFKLEQRNWAEGIGWYTQRTITLDAGQARQLQQLLAVQSPQITRALQTPARSPVSDDARGRIVPFRRRRQVG